jgi:hypothetical protein
MTKSKWPPARTAALLALVDEGCCRREIAERMGVIINAVTTKLYTLGLKLPLLPAGDMALARTPRLARVRFPRFEDVSKAEAAAIREGAPRSGKVPAPEGLTRHVSLMGNSSGLCVP